MHVSAQLDYALRSGIELAAARHDEPVKRDAIASAQSIPINYLEHILAKMRTAGLVISRRGLDGGFWLARPADQITLADIVRAIDGSLTSVRGRPHSEVTFPSVAQPLHDVWEAVQATLRSILDGVTLADVVTNSLPPTIAGLAALQARPAAG